MKIKLYALPNFPKKKDHLKSMYDPRYVRGYNQALAEIGNIEVDDEVGVPIVCPHCKHEI